MPIVKPSDKKPIQFKHANIDLSCWFCYVYGINSSDHLIVTSAFVGVLDQNVSHIFMTVFHKIKMIFLEFRPSVVWIGRCFH